MLDGIFNKNGLMLIGGIVAGLYVYQTYVKPNL